MLPKHLLEPYARRASCGSRRRTGIPSAPAPTLPGWRTGEKVCSSPIRLLRGAPVPGRVVYRVVRARRRSSSSSGQGSGLRRTLTAFQYVRQTDTRRSAGLSQLRYPSAFYTFLGFNLKDPRFADKRVRQAFAYAISKRELIDGVVAGTGPRGQRPIRPGTWATRTT